MEEEGIFEHISSTTTPLKKKNPFAAILMEHGKGAKVSVCVAPDLIQNNLDQLVAFLHL